MLEVTKDNKNAKYPKCEKAERFPFRFFYAFSIFLFNKKLPSSIILLSYNMNGI